MAKKGKLIVFVGDEHCGSSTGLMPPGEWQFDTGGSYNPSPAQNWIWEQWEKAWDMIATLRRGRKLIVVNNGDAVDGVHHGTREIITQNKNEQARIHCACMDWAMKKVHKFDELYYVRGTEVHVSDIEEEIARDLGAEARYTNNGTDGSYVFDQLFLQPDIGTEPLIDICHHGSGVGSRAWTKGNSFRSQLLSYYFFLRDTDLTIPRYVIRAHLHTLVRRGIYDQRYIMEGMITPSFQLKTHFAHRIANMNPLSDIGLGWIIVDKDRTEMNAWKADIPKRTTGIRKV